MLFLDFFKKFMLFAPKGSVVRRISWLTLIGMVLSFSAFLLVLNIMTALNLQMRERILAVEPHLILSSDAGKIDKHPALPFVQKQKDWDVSVVDRQDVIIRTFEGRFRGAQAWGDSSDRLRKMFASLGQHRSFNGAEEILSLKPGEVAMGVDLAHVLGVFEGQEVTLVSPEGLLLPPTESPKFEKVLVRQILSTQLGDIDANTVFFERGQALNSLRNSAARRVSIEIRLPDANEASKQKQELSKQFKDLKIETWFERNSALFFALKLEKLMIGLFMGMAALVAGLSLISVLSLLISQKRRTIGLLQCLGLSKKLTHQLFFRMGALLALLGLGIGSAIGISVSLYLQFKPLNILPNIYYDSQIPARLDPWFIAVSVLVGGLLSVAASWWVTRSAMQVSPHEALRS